MKARHDGLRSALLICLALCLGLAATAVPAAHDPAVALRADNQDADARHAADIQRALIDDLQRDGYLDAQAAAAARARYLASPGAEPAVGTGADAHSAPAGLWERYFSWTGLLKLVGVAFLLVAFSGALRKLATWLRVWILRVPTAVYQSVLLVFTLLCAWRPALLWPAQAYYVAVFGVFATVLVSGWIYDSQSLWRRSIERVASWLRLPEASLLCVLGIGYFGALALGHQSALFGFAAVVCLSGVLSFGVYYRPGVLSLYFDENAIVAVVLGHLAVVLGYVGLKLGGALPAAAGLFAAGIEYYCTIAMGVGFLAGASPFWRRRRRVWAYAALFVPVVFAALAGYFLFDLKVIGSLVGGFAVLLALEWVGYYSYRVHYIVGTFVVGLALVGLALALERYAGALMAHFG